MSNQLATINTEIGTGRRLTTKDAQDLWWNGKLSFDDIQQVSMQENGIDMSRYQMDDGSIIDEIELRNLWWTHKITFDKMCDIKTYNKVR